MNGLALSNQNMMAERTPSVIAVEINNIKEQTKKMVLYNSIEIGRRLVEAKGMLGHGEWGEWLEKSVDYSQRTANNLMRIFDEYGSNQITFFGDNAKSQALANLSYTQAVALLGVPEEERETFIKDHDIDNMSTRELQKAIKEKEQALKEKEELEAKLDNALKKVESSELHYKNVSESYQRLEKTNQQHYQRATQLQEELENTKNQLSEAQRAGDMFEVNRLQTSLQETENELKTSKKTIEELERQLKEKPIEVKAETIVEKVPEEVEKELEELRQKLSQNNDSNKPKIKFGVYFDELVNNFKELIGALAQIKQVDPEAHEKYKNAVKGLIEKMSERL